VTSFNQSPTKSNPKIN